MAEERFVGPEHTLDDLGRSMWGVHHMLASTPRPTADDLEGRLALIEAESAAREVLTRYTYFYDGKNLDGLMGVFHDDCKLVNPRGTYEGIEAIRENYGFLMGLFKMVFHYAPNVMVRVLDDRRSAWLASYLFSIGVVEGQGLHNGNCSSYVARVVLDDGVWKIREMRITTNVPMEMQPRDSVMAPSASPPDPTTDVSSADWVGPEWKA